MAVSADGEPDFGSGALDIALQFMAGCPSLWYVFPLRDVPRTPLSSSGGPCALRVHLAYVSLPTVSGAFVAPAPCTRHRVPLPCPIPRLSAALISPPWHVLDGPVQSRAPCLLPPHAPILVLSFLRVVQLKVLQTWAPDRSSGVGILLAPASCAAPDNLGCAPAAPGCSRPVSRLCAAVLHCGCRSPRLHAFVPIPNNGGACSPAPTLQSLQPGVRGAGVGGGAG